jgi:hypothetical protein
LYYGAHASLEVFKTFQVSHRPGANEGCIFHAVQGEGQADMRETLLVRMSRVITWRTVEVFTLWTVKNCCFFFTKGAFCGQKKAESE